MLVFETGVYLHLSIPAQVLRLSQTNVFSKEQVSSRYDGVISGECQWILLKV